MDFESSLPTNNLPLNNMVRRFLKRGFDIVGSSVLLIILAPAMFLIYILIRKDGPQVIFSHQRVGERGQLFGCLKFRTMVVNAQEVLAELLENDEAARKEWEKDFKLKFDPRITKIGAFLRKTSLDELPQLFNVLKGEMSLVGPRPVINEEMKRYGSNAGYYLSVRPGMTGLWQVSGRNDVSYSERVNLDIEYVTKWSFWGDVKILAMTVGVVLNKEGSY
ncbi:sugar transferase [Marinobacter sp. Hex_13]|uniref:sugar transferase n=1 Tax=Marinobacter sp. Hex_13 TaxID=1795866 RepID=UPI000AE92085|nr:sugar transferase [Marinobacter sp. Hex_13]